MPASTSDAGIINLNLIYKERIKEARSLKF